MRERYELRIERVSKITQGIVWFYLLYVCDKNKSVLAYYVGFFKYFFMGFILAIITIIF